MKIGWTVLLVATLARGQSGGHWLVLPPSVAPEAGRPCSMQAPKIELGWAPSGADIAGLEQRLPEIARLEAESNHHIHIAHPEKSFRQYVGIRVCGRRYIYVNAGPLSFTAGSRKHLDQVSDGGESFWSVLFDPEARAFSALRTNGYA